MSIIYESYPGQSWHSRPGSNWDLLYRPNYSPPWVYPYPYKVTPPGHCPTCGKCLTCGSGHYCPGPYNYPPVRYNRVSNHLKDQVVGASDGTSVGSSNTVQ